MSGTLRVPCVIMRGGTSKALFFHEASLPEAGAERDAVVMSIMGSGDPRQIDGLGGADVLTSKVAIVSPSTTRDDADVTYTFGQVGIAERTIDWGVSCGNIAAAVAPFAIEEGLVQPTDPQATVRIYCANTGKTLEVRLGVAGGKPLADGALAIAGVPGTAAEIEVDFCRTVGSMTGKLLPTGNELDHIYVRELGRCVAVSVVDIASAAAFFHAHELGLSGAEGPGEFTDDVLAGFQAIQRAAAEAAGMPGAHGWPRPVCVAEPRPYREFMSGTLVAETDADFLARRVVLPPPRLHKAFAATGAVCAATAALLEGTVVNKVSRPPRNDLVRIGHPTGVFPVRAKVVDGHVQTASLLRTARRLMTGEAVVRRVSPAGGAPAYVGG
jgi:2-methylaconitate cis-trans-isomerase PrpF